MKNLQIIDRIQQAIRISEEVKGLPLFGETTRDANRRLDRELNALEDALRGMEIEECEEITALAKEWQSSPQAVQQMIRAHMGSSVNRWAHNIVWYGIWHTNVTDEEGTKLLRIGLKNLGLR